MKLLGAPRLGARQDVPSKGEDNFLHLVPPTRQKEIQHPTGLFRFFKQHISHSVNAAPTHFTK